MEERKAIYYGEVELISGIICDGYITDDGEAVMSERGTAKLLNLPHSLLNRMFTNSLPKNLIPFYNKGLSMFTNYALVTANQSPYKGRKIVVYSCKIIENLICAYVLALANDKLRKNQIHIGKRCAILQSSLVRTALETAIKEACGLEPQVQKTAQKHYADAIDILHKHGFSHSLPGKIATKQDITSFLNIRECTLNSFLRKHRLDIVPIILSREQIKSLKSKANRMNGYSLDDVAKIAFSMDTEVGIELKRKMFGDLGHFARLETKEEVEWSKILSRAFLGFGFYHGYKVGPYQVDFFVEKMQICLECNGYSHRYYNKKKDEEREEYIKERYGLVRFHHQITLEALFNGVLQAKQGEVVYVYDKEDVRQSFFMDTFSPN